VLNVVAYLVVDATSRVGPRVLELGHRHRFVFAPR
jgi:hypothetical protein